MTDLAKTIAAKSDQLNADDLLAGPRTITITGVRGFDSADQPIAIYFDGDEGKPYKPCKSMRRVMVHCWGPDGNTYAGKRMTLYCDQNVQFGGIKVGGIRISHLSHIDRDMVLPLNVTRGKKAPYSVKPLRAEVHQKPEQSAPAGSELTLTQLADAYEQRIKAAPSTVKLKALRAANERLRNHLDQGDPERLVELEKLWNDRYVQLEDAERSGE